MPVIRIRELAALASVLWAPSTLCASQTLNGVWQSQGYGNVYEIRGTTLNAFEVTTRTCVPSFAAARVTTSIPGSEASFRARSGDVFFIAAGTDEDNRLLVHPNALSKLSIHRLPRMPAVCDAPTANTASGNFEVFAHTFAEHYISFDLRHIDWDKIVADNRGKITSRTTPAQLFDVLNSMLKPLGDLHTGIGARSIKRETQDFFRPGSDRVIKGGIEHFAAKGRRALFAAADRAHVQGKLRSFCNGQLQYGHLDSATGYLRILSFSGYSKKKGEDQHAVKLALDRIFSDPRLRAFVIDARLSFGGDDRLGLAIASRLANTDYLAYTLQARTDPVDRQKWTTPDPIYVRRSSRPGFRGPVVELTGPITMSAAETFTLALMGRTPHVTRIGENTQGVFCDVLERHLPNGWTFGLPNSVYRTAEGAAFDARGIPADISVPVFADDDVAAGRDPALAMAVQVLKHAINGQQPGLSPGR